jgi:hypothetical protein
MIAALIRSVCSVSYKVLKAFASCISMCIGLWLGSVLPEQATNLMVLSFIGTVSLNAVFIAWDAELQMGVRLAAAVTSAMAFLPYLAIYSANVAQFEAAGKFCASLMQLNLILMGGYAAGAIAGVMKVINRMREQAQTLDYMREIARRYPTR